MKWKIPLFSLFLSVCAGLINIYGIRQFDFVTTNMTGHFSNFVLTSQSVYWLISAFLAYFVGGFAIHYLFLKSYKALIVSPLIILFGLWAFIDVPCVLLAAMAMQNAYGIRLTAGLVRPSQITGIVMNLSSDLANDLQGPIKLDAKGHVIKLLNILGFVLGGMGAMRLDSFQICMVFTLLYAIVALISSFVKD